MNNDINLEQLIIKNKSLKKLNNDYLQLIKKNKEEIRNNEKIIWRSCNHEWVRDKGCYDDVVFYCKKCNLWRDRYLYQ